MLAALVVLVALTAAGVGALEINDRARFVWLWLAHGAVLGAVAWWVLRGSAGPRGFPIIILGAVLLRGLAMTAPDTALSTDTLRYVWDGRIQWAGFNPFLYAPADSALAHLRDAVIFPGLNQKEVAVTIYPPAAQVVFMAAARLGEGVQAVRLMMAAFEALTIWALIGWLSALGQPRERVVIYAWHPLPIWDLAGQGHIDAATTAFAVCAILAATRGRQGWSGALLAAAALTKYYPAVLAAALWRRWRLAMPLAFVAAAAMLYAPYVWTAGTRMLGFLGNHLDNEGYVAGYGFHIVWILRDFGIADPPGRLYVAIAGTLLLAVVAWAFLWRSSDEIRPAQLVAIAFTFVLATSPHYPWYMAWLAALLVAAPRLSALVLTLLCGLLYMPLDDNGGGQSIVYALVFGLPLAILLAEVIAPWLCPRSRRATSLPRTG